MQLVQLIKEGGFIMFPLLLCSLLIWIVFFERMYFLYQFKMQSVLLMSKARGLIKEKKFEEAKGLSHNVHPLIGTPFLVVFEDSQMELEKWEAKMTRRLKETQIGLKKYLWILGTIGSSAPFIGLFGTVVGIIKSFESIASTGKSGFAVVAAGLGEALIATAAGIIVAVIAVVFYNYFQTRLSTLSVEFKNQLEDLRDSI
ncbi:MAG: MotA/TolQ/ExbB proton channel family protein [Bdellovibrionota bacterium]|jgi:biopolymer transport protein ExbB/TolQ|nr:MotA/TolQ/ExbB proton channel family protein [Bdellovibrionota bacterium]